MIPKATENAVTTLLKDRLKQFGVSNCRAFGSLQTPSGRREVDLFCKNGGGYVIEAKFLEHDLIKAVAKIQNDYIKHHKELGISGGFAVLYPHELSVRQNESEIIKLANKLKFKVVMLFLPEDSRRNFRVVEGTLDEISGAISTQILSPPDYLSPSIDYVIMVLRDAAHSISAGLRHIAGSELEGIFGGQKVFENILEYEEGTIPEEDLRLASAYLLVNQLLFYHVLSRKNPNRFSEIDLERLRSPSDLSRYFSRVLEVNYHTVFSYDVASMIPTKFMDEVNTMIAAIQGISAEKIGSDILGTIFHDLIPLDVRKKVAAFYTNVLAAEMLAWLSIDKPNMKVADFACGSGGLLVAAYRRKKALIEETRTYTSDDHRRFVEDDLLGIDVMPFAANVAACHLALQTPEYHTDHVKVAIWDSTDVNPGQEIPSIASLQYVLDGQTSLLSFIEHGEYANKKGVVQLGTDDTRNLSLDYFDVVIMNPPFTRQERIPAEYKEILQNRFQEYNDAIHGQMGYYAYFILLADKFLQKGGRIAMVLPASILRHKSNQGIRELLADKYQIEYLISVSGRSAFSESTRLREVLLIAKKGKSSKVRNPVLVFLGRLPKTLPEAHEIGERLSKWKDGDLLDKYGVLDNVFSIDTADLTNNTDNWYRWMAFSNSSLSIELNHLLTSDKLTSLGDLCQNKSNRSNQNKPMIRGLEMRGGKVQRLILISDSKRAIKSSDLWIVINETQKTVRIRNRFTDVEIDVPQTVLRHSLRRISGLQKLQVDNDKDYIITDGFSGFDQFEDYSMTKFKERTLDNVKSDVTKREGNLHLGWRYDISAPGTCGTAFYSDSLIAPTKLFFSANIEPTTAKIIVLSFNSILGLLQILSSRVETRGAFLELFGYILEETVCLDPDKLSHDMKQQLIQAFDEIKDIKMPSIFEQLKTRHEARKKIDCAVLTALGIEVKEEQLEHLYSEIANEIEILKTLMKEKGK